MHRGNVVSRAKSAVKFTDVRVSRGCSKRRRKYVLVDPEREYICLSLSTSSTHPHSPSCCKIHEERIKTTSNYPKFFYPFLPPCHAVKLQLKLATFVPNTSVYRIFKCEQSAGWARYMDARGLSASRHIVLYK